MMHVKKWGATSTFCPPTNSSGGASGPPGPPCGGATARATKERSKYSGLSKKMQSWFGVAEACLIKDTLRVLKQLSMFFQADSSNVIGALPRIAIAKEKKLLALKTRAGKSEQKLLNSYETETAYKGVHLSKTDLDEQRFSSLKGQLCQELAGNLDQRFPCTELLDFSQVLDKSTWPQEPVQRSLYGDTAVMALCKKLKIASEVTAEIIWGHPFMTSAPRGEGVQSSAVYCCGQLWTMGRGG
jgi:hypothetical protein